MSELTPRTNTQFFGHANVERQLLHDIQAGKLAHGLLLSGPRGIGKATLAYRLARMLLSGNDSMELDENDPVFRRIVSGSHSDLLVVEQEFDPKKEELSRDISVEQARGIAEFLSLTPGESQWRVVIVDAVDAFNMNAANAILKILEEPPPQAVLLLVSHNAGRLLPTIRSRCRLLKFAPLPQEDFMETLRFCAPDCTQEERKSLHTLSGGSPGVALELKEQGALEVYGRILDVLSTAPTLDALKLHGFTEQLLGGKGNDNWRLFTHLMLFLLERTAKTAAGLIMDEVADGEQEALNRLSALHPPAIWALKWQQCADQFSLAQARYLDYKQLCIAFFHSISQKEGFQLGNTAA